MLECLFVLDALIIVIFFPQQMTHCLSYTNDSSFCTLGCKIVCAISNCGHPCRPVYGMESHGVILFDIKLI